MRFMTIIFLAACTGPTTPTEPTTPLPTPTDIVTPTPVTPVTPATPYIPPGPIPEVTAPRNTVLGHAQECAQVLGPIPGFDCIEDADPMPVTVDGVQALSTPDTCDKPSLLEGSCNIYTRAGSKMGTFQDGTPNPDVEFVFTCRSQDTQAPTDQGGVYHDVAMIGHNATTGATCYFQDFPSGRVRYFPSPLTAGATPDYGTTDAAAIWDSPDSTAGIGCNSCHSNDPWIHSPWIDQLPSRRDATQPLVPWTDGNETPYHVVGSAFRNWSMSYFDMPSNACTSCHRVGTGGCDSFVRYSAGDPNVFLPLSDATSGEPWMPTDWTGTPQEYASWQTAVDELVSCCNNPGQAMCNVTPTPVGLVYNDPNLPTNPPPPTDTGGGPGNGDTGLACMTPDDDIGSTTGASAYTGNTCGAGHDFLRSCGEIGANTEDLAVTWTAPSTGTFTFDTFGSGYDTTLSLRTDCGGGDTELTCNDDSGNDTQSQVTHTATMGDVIVIVIDGYDGSSCGSAVLNITAP